MARHVEREVLATLSPETVSKRKLPVNFSPEHLTLFEHDLQRTIPPTQLLKFTNVHVSSEGLLFKGTQILPESFAFPDHLDQWKRRSVLKFLASNHLLRRRRVIDRDVLWITDYWSKEYFHWLTDVLSRLFVVRDRINDLLLILPYGFVSEYMKSSLEAFGVKHFEVIERDEVLECRSLLLPTHTAPSGHYNDEIIRGVRNVLLSAYSETQTEERIYISRQRAAKRRIVNEDEVTSILRNHGFQTVFAEDLSFAQQVKLFCNTRHLVSNHGAGLVNMLFMNEGASVFELRHKADRINNCYFTLSSALNLNYFYQACEPANHVDDPHTADLLVNRFSFEENLSLFFNHKDTKTRS